MRKCIHPKSETMTILKCIVSVDMHIEYEREEMSIAQQAIRTWKVDRKKKLYL